MKKINDYFIGKPLDVKYDNGYNVVINRDELLNILRQIQIDTMNNDMDIFKPFYGDRNMDLRLSDHSLSYSHSCDGVKVIIIGVCSSGQPALDSD